MKSITSNLKYADFVFPMRKAKFDLLIALAQRNGITKTFAEIEPYFCDGLREETECRKAKWVQYYIEAIIGGVDLDSIPNISDCSEFSMPTVIEFAQGYATYTTSIPGNNNDLVFTSKVPGPLGNLLTITYVATGTPNSPLSVSLSSTNITVILATNGSSVVTTTAAQVKSAIEASAAVNSLISVSIAAGNDGSGVVSALSIQRLAGG